MACNVYYENNKVNSTVIHQHVLKVFDCGATLFLTRNQHLLISKQTDKSDFTKLREGVKDAAYSYPLFYIVDSGGCVFKTNIEQINDNRWDQIEMDFKIQEISSNADGVLMVTEGRELVGMGNFQNVLKSDEPKIVECFSNFKILQLCTGDNFAIVLVQQKSLSTASLNKEDCFIDRTKQMGREILKTQVWSFGSINKGLLGTGDHIKRNDTAVVVKLADIGVNKIYCGSHHAAALTLDGRLFLWGFNDHQQISLDPSVGDLSAPTEFKTEINGKLSKNILAVACGSSSTTILLNDLNFRVLGRNGGDDQNEEFASDIKYEHDAGSVDDSGCDLRSIPYIASHGKVLLVNRKNIPMFLLNYFTDEQKMVKMTINAHLKYVKPMRNHYEETAKLVETYDNLMFIMIVNLQTVFDLLTSDSENLLENTTANVHFSEIMREFHRYLRNICDIRSFYSFDHYSKQMERKLMKIVIEKPFTCLDVYDKLLDLIYDLRLYNNPKAVVPSAALTSSGDGVEIEELKCQTVERKKAIKDFLKTIIPQRTKEADDTFTFWQLLNDSHVKQELHEMERRFILDSQNIALKLHDRTNIFSSNRFILFNDYFVCLLNRTEFIPIHLVWLQSFSTPNSTKFSFKIITPESHHKVYALTSIDKNEWQNKIRECTWRSLRINPGTNQALPVSRYGSYKFSEKNQKYPNYEVEGRWFDGKFYDLCHIRIPSANRTFKCRINKAGEVNGFGLVEDETFSYHGEFLQGKLNGYGSWRSKSKGSTSTTYQGYFKSDKFHGFGILSNANGAFYGEFVNGNRNGYGIEDDGISGNKYIGMWQDGRRQGAGILITMDGSYFEGIFANNNLSGDGLAIFPNNSYYIGEVTIDGPNGNGQLHLPDAEIIEEIMELDDAHLKMRGNILKGTLGGSWDKVAILNGNLVMNEIFLKTPNSSNYLKIKPEKKWATLFDSWRESVFGPAINPELLGIHDRWNRVSIYMNRKRNFDNDMKKNFMLINREPSRESLELDDLSFSPPQPPTSFGRSNSSTELYLHESARDFDTASLRSFSDYSIAESIMNNNKKVARSTCDLNLVPSFVNSSFDTLEAVAEMKEYFQASIIDDHHPISCLVHNIRRSFCASYGNWKCKPTSILSKIAMGEWISIIKRIYNILRLLFPGLPPCSVGNRINGNYDEKDENCKLLAPLNFMHQMLLNDEIYSCFFLLYASKSSKQDELYSQRLTTCEKKTNEELRNLLKIEPNLIPLLENEKFYEAIRMLQRLSQKYCPSEMLEVIRDTYQLISDCAAKVSSRGDLLSADNLLAVTIYLIVKANINHLGAELSLLTDLMEDDIERLINIEQYIYTTLKIGYFHTISTRFFHN